LIQRARLQPIADHRLKVVLIADEEVVVRNMVGEALRQEYQVLVAVSGAEALQLSRNTEGVIDVLLCDIPLPSMNGLAACRQIRAERPQIKVLLTSAGILDALPEPAEACDVLQKPFHIGELRSRLEQLLAESTPAPKARQVILVVDHNLNRRNFTERILRDSGYTVLTARTPQQGAEIADGAESIDLVIAAVRFDGAGVRLAERIDASSRDISTLLVSHFDPALLRELPGFSAQPEFLQNPFTREALLQHVSRLLGGSRES
jgi:CheY-like chemotaxis protein